MLPYICRIWFILIMGYRIVDSAARIQITRKEVWYPHAISTYSPWNEVIKKTTESNMYAGSRQVMNAYQWIWFSDQTATFNQNDITSEATKKVPYDRIKQTDQTATFNQNDITSKATKKVPYDRTKQTGNNRYTTIFTQNYRTRKAQSITPYDRTKQTEETTNGFPNTESIIYTVIKNKFGSVSQAGQTTTLNQNDIIQHSTNITTYGSTTQTDVCIKITAGVAAFLRSIIVILSVVISILRRKLRKASYTCLTVRRDRNIYNETTHHLPAPGHYLEITPLAEMSASGYRPTEQQLIDQIQHVDTSGYLIPSSSFQRNEDQYESI